MTTTASQQEALTQMTDWLFDPMSSPVFVLSGAAGTGKTYTVNSLICLVEDRKVLMQNWGIPNNGIADNINICATTNSAADVLNLLTNDQHQVVTLHSLFNWRLNKNPITGVLTVDYTQSSLFKEGTLIILDEASMLNQEAFNVLMQETKEHNYKVLMVCDLAQLPPVKESELSFAHFNFPQYDLTEFVRNSNKSFQDLLNNYRQGILSKNYFLSFEADNIIPLEKEEYKQHMLNTLTTSNNSKYISYKNDNVAAANNFITNHMKGTPNFENGEIGLICNTPYSSMLKVNTLLQVFTAEKGVTHIKSLDLDVNTTIINSKYITTTDPSVFPSILVKLRKLLTVDQDKSKQVYAEILKIERTYLDLRPAYAMTVNRSQGQSLDDVFIDLTAFRTVKWNRDLFHRLMYVALSRAKNNVFITGSLS